MKLILITLVAVVVGLALACTESPSPPPTKTVSQILQDAEDEWERKRELGRKYISIVIDHIERGVPIQYMSERMVYPPPSPECDPALVEWPSDYAEFCFDEAIAGIESGEMEDYLWSEDEQCYEWHQMLNREWHLAQGIEPEKYDLRNYKAFPWDAEFHPTEEWQKLEEQFPLYREEQEVGSQGWLTEKVASSDHWQVDAHDWEISCIWLVSDDGDAIYAFTNPVF